MNKLLCVSLVLVLSSCASKFGKVMKSKDNEYKYKMAENYYAQKKYNFAQQLFDELYPYVNGTSRFEDLYYKNAYAYYYQKEYENAESIFRTFTEKFPNSPRAEECEYMRAYCFYKQIPKVELDQSVTSKTMALMQAFSIGHPGSTRAKEAAAIAEECRGRLEEKEYLSAILYYNLSYFRASAISLTTLMEDYPDSQRSDEYKMLIVKSWYKFAENSVPDKQEERFGKVLTEAADFRERFKDSKYVAEVDDFKSKSENNIKLLKNEQAKATAQR